MDFLEKSENLGLGSGLKNDHKIYDPNAANPLSHFSLANHLIKTDRSKMGMDEMVGFLKKEGLSDEKRAVGDASKVLGAIHDILEAKEMFKL